MGLKLSVEQQLAIRRTLDQCTDQVIGLTHWVANYTGLRGNLKLTKTQVNQLQNVALQLSSVGAIAEWVDYQASRESTSPAWSYLDLNKVLAAWLGLDPQSSPTVPGDYQPPDGYFYTIWELAQQGVDAEEALDEGHLPLLWIKLARLFVGYFRWHALIVFKERGDDNQAQQEGSEL